MLSKRYHGEVDRSANRRRWSGKSIRKAGLEGNTYTIPHVGRLGLILLVLALLRGRAMRTVPVRSGRSS